MAPKILKFLLVVVLLVATTLLLYFQGLFGQQQNAHSLGRYLDQNTPYSIHGGSASIDKLNSVLKGNLDFLKNVSTLLNKADQKLLNEEGSHFILNPNENKLYAYSKSQGVTVIPKSGTLIQNSMNSTVPLPGRLPFIALNQSLYHSFLPNLNFQPLYFGKEQNSTALYISANQKKPEFWTTLKPVMLSNNGFMIPVPWLYQDIYMSSDSLNLLGSAIDNDALRQLIQPWFSGEITVIKTKDHIIAFLHALPDSDLEKFEQAMLNELSSVKLNDGFILKGISGNPLLPNSASLYARMLEQGMVLTTSKSGKAASNTWNFKPRRQTGSYTGQKKRIVNLKNATESNRASLKQIFSPKDLIHLATLGPLDLTYNSKDNQVDLTVRHSLGAKGKTAESHNVTASDDERRVNFASFKNHRTSKNEVLFQNAQNNLVRIKGDGKTEKVKSLNEPILGNIQQIDFFKNGKYQYLFNTSSQLHLVDILGRDVRGFPKSIFGASAGILCVDYDGKKNYRYFIPMKNGTIRGYYRDGKDLPGWSPKKDVGQINHAGQHLTFRNKDYLLFKNSKGKLFSFKRNGDLRNDAVLLDDIGENDFILNASSHGFSGVYNGLDGKTYYFGAEGKTKVIESLIVKPGSSSVFVELNGKAPAELISQIEGGLEVGHIKNGIYEKLATHSIDGNVLKLASISTKGKKDQLSTWQSDGSIKVFQGLYLKELHNVDGIFVFESKKKLYQLSEKSGGEFHIRSLN